MRSLLKRLWKDRRGNALIIAGAALPLVIGSAGLATDTIQWATWKRQLQRAADSGALAGVYAQAQSQTPSTAVAHDLEENWCVNSAECKDALLAGYPQVTTPANPSGYIYTTKVVVAAKRTLGFSSLFMSAAPTITASATAAMIPEGEYCLVALARTGPAITLGGSSSANLGCGAISNSSDPTSAVGVNGNAYSFIADPVAAVGGMPATINGATDLQPYHTAMPDPYEGKYPTDIPPGMNCNGANSGQNSYSVTTGTGQDRVTTTHLRGNACYSNWNMGGGTVYLDPGVYYLNNTSISLSGQQKIVGTGVTLIFTGTNPGTISMNGNSAINLSAPTTGPYAKMLMIQSSNATVGNDNLINGNNNTSLDGAIYFPKADMTFTGSSANSTKCAMVVSYTVEFTGNTNIQNDTTGCTADTKVSGWQVRLIA
jgi:hypothetical protein